MDVLTGIQIHSLLHFGDIAGYYSLRSLFADPGSGNIS
jgi:hypothetical protein